MRNSQGTFETLIFLSTFPICMTVRLSSKFIFNSFMTEVSIIETSILICSANHGLVFISERPPSWNIRIIPGIHKMIKYIEESWNIYLKTFNVCLTLLWTPDIIGLIYLCNAWKIHMPLSEDVVSAFFTSITHYHVFCSLLTPRLML